MIWFCRKHQFGNHMATTSARFRRCRRPETVPRRSGAATTATAHDMFPLCVLKRPIPRACGGTLRDTLGSTQSRRAASWDAARRSSGDPTVTPFQEKKAQRALVVQLCEALGRKEEPSDEEVCHGTDRLVLRRHPVGVANFPGGWVVTHFEIEPGLFPCGVPGIGQTIFLALLLEPALLDRIV
jgi:hypothetical protein